MKKLLLLAASLWCLSIGAFAQQGNIFRYGGTTIISASTFVSAVIAPAVPGQQNLVTHWFAEPISGSVVSFWASFSNTCQPAIANSGITSMVIANNSPIMDGGGYGALFAAPVSAAICAQAAVQAIPGLVTYGIIP